MMYYNGFGGGYLEHSLFGELFMVLCWVALIIFIVWALRHMIRCGDGHCKHTMHSSNSALDILKERYAKSEISKEEFDAKKKDLSE